MKIKICCIYGIKSTLLGKIVYVGATRNFKSRMKDHKVRLKAGNHNNRNLLSHYKIHGIKDFEFEILSNVINHDLLIKTEHEFIEKINPPFNLLANPSIPKGQRISEEHREKHRAITKAHWDNNPERKRKLGEWVKTIPRTDRHREHHRSMCLALRKPVLCINNGKIYSHAKAAAIELGCNSGSINRICNGHEKTSFGYSFKFADQNNTQ